MRGVLHSSRRQSDFLKRLSSKDREENIIEFIAACNAKMLVPYIRIIGNDRNYRQVDYAIEIPSSIPMAKSSEEWHEEIGPVLWWAYPIKEPPYVGTPLDADWTGYHTHWTPIIIPEP